MSDLLSGISGLTVTVNGEPATVEAGDGSSGAFERRDVPLVEGPNAIQVEARDAAGNLQTIDLTVTRIADTGLPPDPETVAPPVEAGVSATVFDSTAFLYTGADPIQTGVAPGTIQLQRAAVIRGRVLDQSDAPLPGATISILNHPELGQTLSRADGRFDLAVNGGGLLTVSYHKADFLPTPATAASGGSGPMGSSPPWRETAILVSTAMAARPPRRA